jgi:hypothetical protein
MSTQLNERLRAHAAAGITKMQACDLEGCSEKTARDALDGTNLKWRTTREYWWPKGTTGDRLSSFHHEIKERLQHLRNTYPQEEVSRMTGMNMGEQAQALQSPQGATYNWTIAQIVRIAEASNMTPLSVLQDAVRAMERRS